MQVAIVNGKPQQCSLRRSSLRYGGRFTCRQFKDLTISVHAWTAHWNAKISAERSSALLPLPVFPLLNPLSRGGAESLPVLVRCASFHLLRLGSLRAPLRLMMIILGDWPQDRECAFERASQLSRGPRFSFVGLVVRL
jgi:hypothetical protein